MSYGSVVVQAVLRSELNQLLCFVVPPRKGGMGVIWRSDQVACLFPGPHQFSDIEFSKGNQAVGPEDHNQDKDQGDDDPLEEFQGPKGLAEH